MLEAVFFLFLLGLSFKNNERLEKNKYFRTRILQPLGLRSKSLAHQLGTTLGPRPCKRPKGWKSNIAVAYHAIKRKLRIMERFEGYHTSGSSSISEFVLGSLEKLSFNYLRIARVLRSRCEDGNGNEVVLVKPSQQIFVRHVLRCVPS